VSLAVVLELDGPSLLGGAGKWLSLEIYGYALDEEGRIHDAVGLTPTFDLEKVGPGIRKTGVQILTAFHVPEGPVDLRFLVREPKSGRTGSLRSASSVPSFKDGTLASSLPLLMDDPRARLVIPTASRAKPKLEIPFRLGDIAFTPQAAPALRNGESRQVCLMTWGGDDAAALAAALIRDDGQALPLATAESRVVDDADGFRRFVMRVTPRDVPPGDYRLRLTVASPGSEGTRSELGVRID
jgi:hypothetical protein